MTYTTDMDHYNVLVLYGGASNEREVSLRSGTCVAAALETATHTATLLDYTGQTIDASDYDVVFPVLHGEGGEDGSVQAVLDAIGLPYVGSDVVGSALCYDKAGYKKHLQALTIQVPDGGVITKDTFQASPLLAKPFVVKPVTGGSSVDTLIIREPSPQDIPAIKALFERYDELLIEQLIIGTELTVGVLGENALPVVEIIPPTDGEFDYQNKYNGKTAELCPPQSISAEIQSAAQKLALTIHVELSCRDLSRTDMIVDETGSLWVLETNTMPGMTGQSLFPKAASQAGLDFPLLTETLIELAMRRQTDVV